MTERNKIQEAIMQFKNGDNDKPYWRYTDEVTICVFVADDCLMCSVPAVEKEFGEQFAQTICDVGDMLSSIAEEDKCPVCLGQNFLPDPVTQERFPCSHCSGKGDYRSWAEQRLAEKDKQIEELKAKFAESEKICEEIIFENNDERIRADNALIKARKEISDWSMRAVVLTAEVERLKAPITNEGLAFDPGDPQWKRDSCEQVFGPTKLHTPNEPTYAELQTQIKDLTAEVERLEEINNKHYKIAEQSLATDKEVIKGLVSANDDWKDRCDSLEQQLAAAEQKEKNNG
jgi:hypothetical protein